MTTDRNNFIPMANYAAYREEQPGERRRNGTVQFIGFSVDRCGTGVLVDSGDVVIDGLNARNTPTAIDARGDANVDARNVDHKP